MKIMNQSELKKNRNNYSRRMFTCEEDEKLKELVKKYENDWQKISKEMKDRNIRQCKERYNHYLSPNIKHSEWNLEEDLKLIEIVEEVGKKWKVFEQYFPGRTEIDIRNRFHVLFRSITKQTKKQFNSYNTQKCRSFNNFSQTSCDINPHCLLYINHYQCQNHEKKQERESREISNIATSDLQISESMAQIKSGESFFEFSDENQLELTDYFHESLFQDFLI